jgi:hypothetical protein
MDARQKLGFGLHNATANLAKQRVNEEAAAPSNATMNAPHGELDAQAFQSFAPGQNVLVNAVDERPVEVKQKSWPRSPCPAAQRPNVIEVVFIKDCYSHSIPLQSLSSQYQGAREQ